MTVHDYSDADDHTRLLNEPINVELNALTERVALATPRMNGGYLGASAVGDECMRKVQFDWLCSSFEGARQRRRFPSRTCDRSDGACAIGRKRLRLRAHRSIGVHRVEDLKGHADGIIIAAPPRPAYLAFPAIWECKCLYGKGWRGLVRDGLAKAYPKYASYSRFINTALVRQLAVFTAVNADFCEVLHMLVPD